MKLSISIEKQWYFQKVVGNWLFTDRVQVSRSQALLKINLKYITYLNVKRQTKTVENKIHDEILVTLGRQAAFRHGATSTIH